MPAQHENLVLVTAAAAARAPRSRRSGVESPCAREPGLGAEPDSSDARLGLLPKAVEKAVHHHLRDRAEQPLSDTRNQPADLR